MESISPNEMNYSDETVDTAELQRRKLVATKMLDLKAAKNDFENKNTERKRNKQNEDKDGIVTFKSVQQNDKQDNTVKLTKDEQNDYQDNSSGIEGVTDKLNVLEQNVDGNKLHNKKQNENIEIKDETAKVIDVNKMLENLKDELRGLSESSEYPDRNYISGSIGKRPEYKIQDIVPQGDAPCPRPPPAPAPPPPDLLDQHNPGF